MLLHGGAMSFFGVCHAIRETLTALARFRKGAACLDAEIGVPGSLARPLRRSARLSCRAFVPKIIFRLRLADLPVQNIYLGFVASLTPSGEAPSSKTLATLSSSCFFQL